MKVIQSHAIYTEKGVIDGFIVMEDETIVDILSKDTNIEKGDIEHYGHARIIPGIIDPHIHGYRTFAARTLHTDEVLGLAKVLPSIGVTAALPTICGAGESQLNMLEAAGRAVLCKREGARLLGIHIEGSFFHPSKHNATPLHEVKEPSIALCQDYYAASLGTWRYMTIAPELTHALDVIEWANAHKILVGGGHTCATYEQFEKAKACGMKSAIHTGNAMTQMDRREVSFLGGVLLDRDIYCEINCDFVHLSKEMLDIMFRIKKNYERFLMISDSDTISGVASGCYQVSGQKTMITEDGRMLLEDGTIAGSCRSILYGIRNLCEDMKLSLHDVWKMSSYNTACMLGIEDKKGSIDIHKDADFVVIDDDYQVIATYVEGECVYRKGDTLLVNPWFEEEVPYLGREMV